MFVRADKRTPSAIKWLKSSDLLGIPVVSTYKYLGVLIDDSVQLIAER
jgi:hypothetical protein